MKLFIIFLLLFTNIYASKIIDVNITQGIYSDLYKIKLKKKKQLIVNVHIDKESMKISDEYNSTDIVLLIDNTASMGDLIKMIKSQMGDIASFVFQNYNNAKIAVATVSEHTNDKNKDAYMVISNFTSDASILEKSISLLGVDDVNNTDFAEAYSYGLSESLKLKWRKNSQKVLFFVGDAWGHNPDPGKDKQLNTMDDLYINDVLNAYQKKKIKICTYYKDDEKRAKKYFSMLSQTTHGFSTPIREDNDLQSDLKKVLHDITNFHYVINSPFKNQVKVTTKDLSYRFNFSIDSSLKDNNKIQIVFFNNGVEIGKISIILVSGKPWGLLYIVGSILFLLFSYLALTYIYDKNNMTTIVDYGFLKHYLTLVFAFITYALLLYASWYIMNQEYFPIIWYKLWW